MQETKVETMSEKDLVLEAMELIRARKLLRDRHLITKEENEMIRDRIFKYLYDHIR